MTQYEVVRCADGHYRRVIYGLGPYIADYPEQALLACIVQGWCPRYASFNYGDRDYAYDPCVPVVLRVRRHLMTEDSVALMSILTF